MDRELKLKVVFDALDKLSGPMKQIDRASQQMRQAMAQNRREMRELQRAAGNVEAFRRQQSTLSETGQKLREAEARLEALGRSMRDVAQPTRTMTREFERAQREAEQLKNTHSEQTQKLEQLRDRLKAAGLSGDNLADAERRLRQEMERTTREAEEQRREMDRLNRIREQSQNMQALGGRISGAGQTASLYVTAPALGLGAGAIAASNEFQTAMTNVSTLIDVTTESMDAMSNSVLAMSERVPVPLADLTSALYDVRSAGIASSDAMKVLEGSARLAVAGLGSPKEAVDLLTSSINAFGLEGAEQTRAVDLLFKSVKYGKTTISQLAQGFGAVAGTVANAGIELDEYLAAVSALTTVGAPASQAHTQIRAAIAGLTRETKGSRAVFQALGARDFKDLINKSGGMVGAFRRIREEVGGNDAAILELFGSIEAFNSVMSLTGPQAAAFNAALGDMRNGANAVDDAFAKQAETQAAKMQQMRNKIEKMLINAAPIIMPALERILGLAVQLADGFNNMSPGMQKAVVYGIALAAALGPVLMVIGGLITTIGVLWPLLSGLIGLFSGLFGVIARSRVFGILINGLIKLPGLIGRLPQLLTLLRTAALFMAKGVMRAGLMMLANPMVLAIMAIVAVLAIAGYLIYTHWDTIKAAFWAAIDLIGQKWEEFKAWLADGWAMISGLFASAGAWISAAWTNIQSAFQTGVGMVGQAWQWIKAKFNEGLTFIQELPGKMMALGSQIIAGLVNGLSPTALTNKLLSIARSGIAAFKNFFGIKSPSRLLAEMGGFMTEGLAIGLDRTAPNAVGAARRIAVASAAAMMVTVPAPAMADLGAPDIAAQVIAAPAPPPMPAVDALRVPVEIVAAQLPPMPAMNALSAMSEIAAPAPPPMPAVDALRVPVEIAAPQLPPMPTLDALSAMSSIATPLPPPMPALDALSIMSEISAPSLPPMPTLDAMRMAAIIEPPAIPPAPQFAPARTPGGMRDRGEAPAMRPSTAGVSIDRIEINITQQPGEDGADLARRVKDILMQEARSRRLGAYRDE